MSLAPRSVTATLLYLGVAGGLTLAPAATSADRDGFLGVLLSEHAVDLAPALDGRIEAISVRLGDSASRGQRLAKLDDEETRQALAGATADLEEARAAREQARIQLANAEETLSRRQRIPDVFTDDDRREARDNRDLAQSGLDIAEAKVRQQEARIEELRTRLAGLEIRAPFDGTVAARYREPGMMAGPGAPVVRLIGRGDLWVRFAVPPEVGVRLGEDVPVVVRLGERDLELVGRVRHVATEIDAASGLLFCEAALDAAPDGDRSILPGRTVRVVLPSAGAP